jgi:hypothetical protein
MTSQQRMLAAAADLAREYAVHWVGAEHIARYILRRRRSPERTEARPYWMARDTTPDFPGNSCRKTEHLPGWSRRRLLSGGAVRAPPSGRLINHHIRGYPMGRIARTAFVIAVVPLALTGWSATTATASTTVIAVDPNSAEGALNGFLQGLGGAFGSSHPSTPSPGRPQSYLYPDFQSCNSAAARLRQPGVTAECNPVGGNSGQYQLIYIPRS